MGQVSDTEVGSLSSDNGNAGKGRPFRVNPNYQMRMSINQSINHVEELENSFKIRTCITADDMILFNFKNNLINI